MDKLRYPKMHPHTEFEIPTSNNMRYAPDMIILKTMTEVKVTVTLKWYTALGFPKMHPHTKLGIPTSKNIGDMHQTQWMDEQTDGGTVQLRYASFEYPKQTLELVDDKIFTFYAQTFCL